MATLTEQVEALIAWARKEARSTGQRHYVRAQRTGAGAWFYVADSYGPPRRR